MAEDQNHNNDQNNNRGRPFHKFLAKRMKFVPSPEHCINCHELIRDVVFCCTECQDFQLCMQCYVCKAEIGKHLSTHTFILRDLGTFSIIKRKKRKCNVEKKGKFKMEVSELSENTEIETNTLSCEEGTSQLDYLTDEEEQLEPEVPYKYSYFYELERGILVKRYEPRTDTERKSPRRRWKALDELDLLLAIARYGYGNWNSVVQALSNHMDDLTPEEVANHYLIYYLLGDFGDYAWNWKREVETIAKVFAIEQATTVMTTPLASNFADIPHIETETLGYMPNRNDYEREFDNDAETLIANLSVDINDDEAKSQFKLAQVQLYQQRLMLRFRKKAIVHNYDLVRKFLRKCPISNLDEAEAVVGEQWEPFKLKGCCDTFSSLFTPFLRFCSRDELQTLYLDLQREFYLKTLVGKLAKYKSHSLTTLSQVRNLIEAGGDVRCPKSESSSSNTSRPCAVFRQPTREAKRKVSTLDETTNSSSSDISDDEEDNLDQCILQRLFTGMPSEEEEEDEDENMMQQIISSLFPEQTSIAVKEETVNRQEITENDELIDMKHSSSRKKHKV